MSLKVSLSVLALAGFGLLFSSSVNAAPFVPAQGAPAAKTGLPVEAVQYRYYKKRRYCFYWDGWHGPGWYWCGYHLRTGYGWGGAPGWNSWVYTPKPKIYVQPKPKIYVKPVPKVYVKPKPKVYVKPKIYVQPKPKVYVKPKYKPH
jgi:hypothetical protein